MKSEKYLTIYLVSKLFRVSSIFGNYEVIHLHQFCIKQTMACGYQVKPKKYVESIRVWPVLCKNTDFHEFLFCFGEIIHRPAVVAILMPPTCYIYIAHLNQGTVWPPTPLKVRRGRFVSHQKGHL